MSPIMAETVELLSPARDLACGRAAVDSGADAVYIGGPSFGARSAAGNSLADIEELCRYAHRFGVRIHAALNTILTDSELEEAGKLAWQLYEAGADALIIQDPGLLQLDLPPLELHASTQQDNSLPEKVRFLRDLGFSQAVLAREMTLEEIRSVSDSCPGIRLEFFVHGALCAGISGRCYLSQRLSGRSANRGVCSQPCRLPMSLRTASGQWLARDRYLLSLKDLCHAASLEELLDAGIRSFKIEGRLKDEGYVRNVTAFYRRRIDGILERREEYARSSRGTTELIFEPDPAKSFNRGFTDYLLHGKKDNFACFDSPKAVGTPVAEVTGRKGSSLLIRPLEKDLVLHNGDKCNFFSRGELGGFRISVARGRELEIFRLPEGVAKGTVLYRNKDAEFERVLSQDGSARRYLDLVLEYRETPGGAELAGREEGGAEACAVLSLEEPQRARDPGAQERNITEHLRRLGGTIYRLRELKTCFSEHWFIPVSRLNALRNDLIRQLEEQRELKWQSERQRRGEEIRGRRAASASGIPPELPPSELRLGYRANILNARAEEFYRRHGAAETSPAYESEPPRRAELMLCRQCLRFCFGMCTRRHGGSTREKLELVIGGESFPLVFDCRKCLMKVMDNR